MPYTNLKRAKLQLTKSRQFKGLVLLMKRSLPSRMLRRKWQPSVVKLVVAIVAEVADVVAVGGAKQPNSRVPRVPDTRIFHQETALVSVECIINLVAEHFSVQTRLHVPGRTSTPRSLRNNEKLTNSAK